MISCSGSSVPVSKRSEQKSQRGYIVAVQARGYNILSLSPPSRMTIDDLSLELSELSYPRRENGSSDEQERAVPESYRWTERRLE